MTCLIQSTALKDLTLLPGYLLEQGSGAVGSGERKSKCEIRHTSSGIAQN